MKVDRQKIQFGIASMDIAETVLRQRRLTERQKKELDSQEELIRASKVTRKGKIFFLCLCEHFHRFGGIGHKNGGTLHV